MIEPEFSSQLDENGNVERIDITTYSIKIMCAAEGCVQIRYIKPQDKSQVTLCKVCSRKARLKVRAERARNRRKNKK